jgi:hypothetical protein
VSNYPMDSSRSPAALLFSLFGWLLCGVSH